MISSVAAVHVAPNSLTIAVLFSGAALYSPQLHAICRALPDYSPLERGQSRAA